MEHQSYFLPYLFLATWVNRRREARRRRQATKRYAYLSPHAWAEQVEHVPADIGSSTSSRLINPDLLPRPVREHINGRCVHQRERIVLAYLQGRSILGMAATCPCQRQPARPQLVAASLRHVSDSAWVDFVHHEYGGEG